MHVCYYTQEFVLSNLQAISGFFCPICAFHMYIFILVLLLSSFFLHKEKD